MSQNLTNFAGGLPQIYIPDYSGLQLIKTIPIKIIRIDLKNGEFKIDKFVFSPRTKIDYILEYILSQEIDLWTSNQNWKSYRLQFDEYIVILFFQCEVLKIIEVFPIVIENSIRVSSLIIELGGESEYSWGKIEINNDIKAGYESVLIRYN